MYRALYRKWRPKTFSDVVGQAGITAALQNQLIHGKIGHAYLFTGTRGTGKTSCAKIFAKAVNCPHRNGADPCCECDICKGIDNGSIMDVVEIDAASNNGVDNIRDLRDETAYTPSQCTYKVYIIDEVHMLSTAAFNALLKDVYKRQVLKAYPPVRFHLALTGGAALEYRIERHGAFSIIGISADIGSEMEQNFEHAPALWARAAAEGLVEKLMALMDTQPRGLLGVSSQTQNEHWRYWVAVASTQAPPAWAQSAQVPAAAWAVFPGSGHQGFYKDITSDPLYPFGHGLSYTEFKYGTVTP